MISTPLLQHSLGNHGNEYKTLDLVQTLRDGKVPRRTLSGNFERLLVFGKTRRSSNHKRDRKVSFAKRSCLEEHHDAPIEFLDVSTEELWFTTLDFHRFTKAAQRDAKTIRLAEEELLIGMDKSHSIAIRLAQSVNKNKQNESLSAKVFLRLDMTNSGLADWCCTGLDLRGLERIASKQLRHSKHVVRQELRSIVVFSEDHGDAATLRSTESASTRRSTGRTYADAAVTAAALAHECQCVTRESRLFARMMGLADELASKEAYSDDDEHDW